jgi:Dyp-type peroxidase family
MPLLEIDDIQGIILFNYGRLRSACYLLLQISEPAATRAWLKSLELLSARFDSKTTDRAINIAFTPAGLSRLGLSDAVMADFAGEFMQGMTGTSHRQRTLGDVGDSSPDAWSWGGPRTPAPHVLLMLFGRDDAVLAEVAREQEAAFSRAGLSQIARLDTNWLPKQREHFGFRDGVSRTDIEGFHTDARPENSVAPGEFILGYLNAYGQYTQRPLVAPEQDPQGLLSTAPDDPSRHDLGMNGSYLVFRQLRQHVGAFWKYVDEQAKRIPGVVDPNAAVRLASKMIGRWPSGTPLVVAPAVDDPARCDENEFFYYRSDDPHGLKCPIGAHIRRANPRDALDPEPGSDRSIEVGKRHRVLRRGRTYGPPVAESMEIPDILAVADTGGDRGLHFICFNTQIGRQFEFIQHTWLNNPKFDGLYEDDDPLVGDRGGSHGKPGGTFTVQAEPVRTRVTGMPRFTQVRGGGYFFMPGIRAVRFLGSLGSR